MKNKAKKNLILSLLVIEFLLITNVAALVVLELEEIAEFDTGGDAVDVYVTNEVAFVNDMLSDSLLSVDVSAPTNPILMDEYSVQGPHELTIDNDMAFIGSWADGLEIVDISDPENMVNIGSYYDGGEIVGCAVNGDTVYACDWVNGLKVLDITNPTNPTLVGSYTITEASSLDASNDIVVCGYENSELIILNVTIPSNPTQIARYDVNDWVGRLKVENDFVYAATGKGLLILDISNPSEPELLYQHSLSLCLDVFIEDDKLFISADTDGLIILNVSDPTNPSEIGTFDDGGHSFGIHVIDDIIYLASKAEGLEIIQIGGSSTVTSNNYPIFILIGITVSYFVNKTKKKK